MRILLTRPEPDAARTAARLVRLGHHVLIDPLLMIEPVAIDKLPVGPFTVVAATSANALRVTIGGDRFDSLRSIPLYAVGGHTGEAAREAGFATVFVAEGDAAALARLLAEQIKHSSRVLHLVGEDRAQDLKALLAPVGIAVETLVLYRMRPAENLSTATVTAIAAGKLDAVLHYSPRSAASFIALAQKQNLVGAMQNFRHLCLSEAVAAPLAAIGAKVEIAARPEETALIDLLES